MEIFTWQARTKKNLTLAQLSKLTGISKSTLNNIENGKVPVKFEQLEMIAKVLNVKIGDIVRSEYL